MDYYIMAFATLLSAVLGLVFSIHTVRKETDEGRHCSSGSSDFNRRCSGRRLSSVYKGVPPEGTPFVRL